MKIAFVSTLRTTPWGGSEELWYQAALVALAKGYEVAFFVYDWYDEPKAWTDLQERGASIHKRARAISFVQRARRFLYRLLGQPDALSINPYRDLTSVKPDKIVITDGSTYYASDDNFLSSLLLKYFAGSYYVICQGNSPYHPPANREKATAFFYNAAKVLFVSANNRKLAFHQLAADIENSMVVQNPVILDNKEAGTPVDSAIRGTVKMAIVGRLMTSDKGQDLVISLLAEPFWKEQNLQINIYGKGADQTYLEELINYYGVNQQVFLRGHASADQIWSENQVLLMPSILEGTPLTLLEAMMKERLCIVTDVGGNAEWITDGVNGYVIPAATTPLISNKLKEIWGCREEWVELAANARRTALSRLDENPGATLLSLVEH